MTPIVLGDVTITTVVEEAAADDSRHVRRKYLRVVQGVSGTPRAGAEGRPGFCSWACLMFAIYFGRLRRARHFVGKNESAAFHNIPPHVSFTSNAAGKFRNTSASNRAP